MTAVTPATVTEFRIHRGHGCNGSVEEAREIVQGDAVGISPRPTRVFAGLSAA